MRRMSTTHHPKPLIPNLNLKPRQHPHPLPTTLHLQPLHNPRQIIPHPPPKIIHHPIHHHRPHRRPQPSQPQVRIVVIIITTTTTTTPTPRRHVLREGGRLAPHKGQRCLLQAARGYAAGGDLFEGAALAVVAPADVED
jgi:hypothetical protein